MDEGYGAPVDADSEYLSPSENGDNGNARDVSETTTSSDVIEVEGRSFNDDQQTTTEGANIADEATDNINKTTDAAEQTSDDQTTEDEDVTVCPKNLTSCLSSCPGSSTQIFGACAEECASRCIP